MPLSVYMDVHVPSSVTAGLRSCGIDVLTSQEDGTREAGDEELLARCTVLERILLTQDTDFFSITAEWQSAGREFSGVLFARHGVDVGRLIRDVELCVSAYSADELRNRLVHLPLQ